MHGILHLRPAPASPLARGEVDTEALTARFLADAHASALSRFEMQRLRASAPTNLLTGEGRSVRWNVQAPEARVHCTGSIVMHVSAPAFAAWAASAPGAAAQREVHVLSQLQLVLQDLADHDVHGCLALTEAECDAYDLDLVQLVAESLDRTSFARLRQAADIHWEGTLVRSLDPPSFVLVVSVDLPGSS
jgi:hypothetical protein